MGTMKATTRLCFILVLICAARLVCTAHQRYNNDNAVEYPQDYADAKLIQFDYLLEKRNKPSLSIVNPLDVLRNRLLLEMVRKQNIDHERKVKLNREILRNVGKRMLPGQTQQQLEHHLSRSPYQQQLQLQLQQLLQPRHTNQFEYAPDVGVYDYIQRPAYIYDSVLAAAALAGSESEGEAARHTPLFVNAVEGVAEEGDSPAYNAIGNEMAKETASDNNNSNGASGGSSAPAQRALGNNGGLVKNVSSHERLAAKDGDEGAGSEVNADYPLRYFYGLRKKHHNMRK